MRGLSIGLFVGVSHERCAVGSLESPVAPTRETFAHADFAIPSYKLHLLRGMSTHALGAM